MIKEAVELVQHRLSLVPSLEERMLSFHPFQVGTEEAAFVFQAN